MVAGTRPAFQNPVLDSNFPDPGVLYHDGRYYAFATNYNGSNVQTALSDDLVRFPMPALRCVMYDCCAAPCPQHQQRQQQSTGDG
jgi:hypothetical protein